MRRFVLFLIIFSISFTISSYGDYDVHDHHDTEDAKVGIEEKLGNLIPNDLVFTDSNGKKVKISALIKKAPTVILPVYYTCPNVCNILQQFCQYNPTNKTVLVNNIFTPFVHY